MPYLNGNLDAIVSTNMNHKLPKPTTITGRIYAMIFDILENNPNGVRWVDLLKMIQEADPSLHPKTVNGCVWQLLEKYPNTVYKPEKGLFKLTKYKV